ncbi:uncharacterized protein LOC133124826 isoform X2 [Conger conger]|uniref:uncharacterized protein LOC133124826 isoform X2 n=1 Tax=Conger conger TaxID=82655 RepID=UPI002A59AC69|nr:uncharacterized protein LOC133124826 isoform X2 [Conger conger]XP_061092330.1 uncharacterized protein LOC133124826 isoform X2 [Conger conger]
MTAWHPLLILVTSLVTCWLVKRLILHIMSLCIWAQHAMAQSASREVRQVGDAVLLHPARTRGDMTDARWIKANKKISNSSECVIFENGSLLIETANKSHTGNYTVELFNCSGRRISKTDIELIIIDAVSQPEIRSSCTLDGHTLLACRTTVRRCRGRIPACIACGLFFSVLVCSMAWLKLYRSPTRHSVDTENIYLTMHGFQERRPENREVEVDNSIYVTRESLQDTSKVTQKTETTSP